MISAERPCNEDKRLKSLETYDILDTAAEQAFDDIAKVASHICDTPISLVSIVDNSRQWFKAKVGLDADETSRDIAFCSHAILNDELFIIEDASKDERFHDNPLVSGEPFIRFYAGAPLLTNDGFALGTLCVIDRKSRKLTIEQKNALRSLSRQVSALLELRVTSKMLKQQNESKLQLLSILSHDLGNAFNGILYFSKEINSTATEDNIIELSQHLVDVADSTYEQLLRLLDWTKNEIKNVPCDPCYFNLEDALKGVLEVMKRQAAVKNITLILNELNHSIYADKNMLCSVFQNILSNAIKFSPVNSEVTVSVVESSDCTIIKIIDQGAGFANEKMSVFTGEANFLSSEGTTGEQGSGFGLNLVYQIMEKHNGSITATNQPEGGACVELLFPKPDNISNDS